MMPPEAAGRMQDFAPCVLWLLSQSIMRGRFLLCFARLHRLSQAKGGSVLSVPD